MKTYMTNKAIRAVYGSRIVCSSELVENLSSKYNARYYNYGKYGWNWDGYLIDGYLVVCGCRNFPTEKECKLTVDSEGNITVTTEIKGE